MNLDAIRLDRRSHTPVSEQIAKQIVRLIYDGALKPGDRLPPERVLAEQLGVSRGTVKRAYGQLAEAQEIGVRQGSGSYVQKSSQHFEQNQRVEAMEIIASAVQQLQDMGFSAKEITNLVNLQALGSSHNKFRKISIMIVSNNHDILSELEQQLSYLSYSSPFLFTLSFVTLKTIQNNPDPVQVLLSYDLIIATTIDYPAVLAIAPMLKNRIFEALLSPRTKTLMELSSLPQNAKIAVIYRTDIFRRIVEKHLRALGFGGDNVLYYNEASYNPKSHADCGVSVLVNFNESPVYTDPDFAARNEAFLQQGGQIIRFGYQIERGSLVYLEDLVQKLIKSQSDD